MPYQRCQIRMPSVNQHFIQIPVRPEGLCETSLVLLTKQVLFSGKTFDKKTITQCVKPEVAPSTHIAKILQAKSV